MERLLVIGLEAIVNGLTALAFLAAGIANALDVGGSSEGFRRWGYPPALRYVTAALEIVGATALLVPGFRAAGLVILGLVMVAAIATLVRARSDMGHLGQAAVFAALLAVNAILWAV